MKRRHNDNPEARVEKLLCDLVQEHGGLAFKWVSPDNPGVPDRIVITPEGRIIFVELKTEIGRLANIQKWQHSRLLEHGVEVRTLKGLGEVKAFIKEVFGCVETATKRPAS